MSYKKNYISFNIKRHVDTRVIFRWSTCCVTQSLRHSQQPWQFLRHPECVLKGVLEWGGRGDSTLERARPLDQTNLR